MSLVLREVSPSQDFPESSDTQEGSGGTPSQAPAQAGQLLESALLATSWPVGPFHGHLEPVSAAGA